MSKVGDFIIYFIIASKLQLEQILGQNAKFKEHEFLTNEIIISIQTNQL